MLFVLILVCCVVTIRVGARPAEEMKKEMSEETTKIREENQVYGSQKNSNYNMWPKSESGVALYLPKQLNIRDEIKVTSVSLKNSEWISLSLIGENGPNEPDENNIAGHIELHFPENTIKLKTVVDGTSQLIEPDNPEHNTPLSIFPKYRDPGSSISIRINITQNEDNNNMQMEIHVGQSFIKSIELRHNIAEIKYLKLDGDIEVNITYNLHNFHNVDIMNTT